MESFDVGADLAAATADAAGRYPQVLIDSLSQWLAGLVVGGDERAELATDVNFAVDELLRVVASHPRVRFVIVSAEVGGGPPPSRPRERLYRQQLGLANQRLARTAHGVLAMTAGIPSLLKGAPA